MPIQVPHAKQRKLWVCNPTKLMACEFLLRFHEARGDKVIVFSDNVFALLHVARALNRPFIYGRVSPPERMAILSKFKVRQTLNPKQLIVGLENHINPKPLAKLHIDPKYSSASTGKRVGRLLL